MRLKLYLTLAVLFITFNCFANKERIDSSAYVKKSVAQLQDSLISVNKQLAELKHTVEIAQNDISSTSSSLANVIASWGFTLALFALIISVAGGIVYYYANKTKKLLNKTDSNVVIIENILTKAQNIQAEVETLSNNMKDNLKELIYDFKNEEIKLILQDLVLHPERFESNINALDSRATIPEKLIPLMIDVTRVLSDNYYKSVMLESFVKYWGLPIILSTEDVTRLFIANRPLLDEGIRFLDFNQIKTLMDMIAEKFPDNLSFNEKLFLDKFIIPLTKQKDNEVNHFYDHLTYKFGIDYYLKFYKPYITGDKLKEWLDEYYATINHKYTRGNTQQLRVDFTNYIMATKTNEIDTPLYEEFGVMLTYLFDRLIDDSRYFDQQLA